MLFVSSAMEQNISRRAVLGAGARLLSGASLARAADEKHAKSKLKVAIFSKHLHFLRGEDLAKAAAEIGFDGIDLAVRKGGHVEADRVRQELPGLVAVIRRHGLDVPMITTDIVDAETPHTEAILKTMAELGIHNYRWGGLKNSDDRPLAAQPDDMKPPIAKRAALTWRNKTRTMDHTHT